MDASFYFMLCFFVIAGSAHLLPTSCGTLSIIKPTFVNRNVTLKFLPLHGWISNIVWKYALGRDVRHKTLKGLEGHVRPTAHYEPYYDTMLFFADRSYNNSRYHIECTNVMMITRSNTVKLHLHENQLIGPIWDNCIFGTVNTNIYCNTSRTTGKTRVNLSVGGKEVKMLEDDTESGVYAARLDSNILRDHDSDIVTCKISNDAYVHDQKNWTKLERFRPYFEYTRIYHDENTALSCEVSNTRPPALIEILVDNQAISDVVHEDLLNETSKTFASKASIMKIDKTWNGKEMCCRKKSAIYGNIKATCKILDMKYGPVVDMAEELSVEEGRNLSLRCKYNHGNPPQESSVVWTRALNNQRWEDTFLQITSVQRADDDIYTCTFTSEMVLSEDQSTVTYFDVGSEYKDSVTKAENDTVILLCVVNSNPKAEISITKGNDILEVEDNGSNLTHTIASSARRPYNVNMKLNARISMKIPQKLELVRVKKTLANRFQSTTNHFNKSISGM
ncbi:hypothetical protein MAR_021921 [Mya arenaria]|uniref:Ig-like domain-containing protein n=1 Tax=Mya arenaria TaxID=6604 RepID=A0ABY7ECM6_MYAAR|nr:hypothetical protein MAR_021921 [Mya arenaria]